MKPGITIERFPYEEPHNLHLLVSVQNEYFAGASDFYFTAATVTEWGKELQAFPRHKDHVFMSEVGSERKEDRWAYYFRFRAFTYNIRGSSALHFRMNTNRDFPDTGIVELCIKTEAARINHLGDLLVGFAKLEHTVLAWNTETGGLFRTRELFETNDEIA